MVSITFLCVVLTIVFVIFGLLIAFLIMTNTSEILKCTNMVNDLERKYYEKQMECAVLTWEINELVEQGAKTSLSKDPKTGGYKTH